MSADDSDGKIQRDKEKKWEERRREEIRIFGCALCGFEISSGEQGFLFIYVRDCGVVGVMCSHDLNIDKIQSRFSLLHVSNWERKQVWEKYSFLCPPSTTPFLTGTFYKMVCFKVNDIAKLSQGLTWLLLKIREEYNAKLMQQYLNSNKFKRMC